MSKRTWSIALLIVSGLLASSGCGSTSTAPAPVEVIGTVKLDGQPLAEGIMYFKTVETGVVERLEINNGEFKGKAQPGTRRVEIICNRPITMVIDGANVEVPVNIIDPSFNLDSTLTAEVTAEGPNRFTFDVKKK